MPNRILLTSLIAIFASILNPAAEAARQIGTTAELLPTLRKGAWPSHVLQLWRQQDWPAVLASCYEWRDGAPEASEPWYCIAMAGMYAKQYQESQRGFEGYLKRVDYSEISHDIFYSHSNVLVQLGKFDEALRAVDEIIKMNGSDPVPWAQRGWILVTAQRYREAKLSCYRALDLNIEYAEAWHIIGAANRGLGRYQLAIEAYRLAVDMPQENSNIKRSEYWFPLGELYVITGQRDKAEGVLEVLETMDAERAEALRKLIAEMR